MPPLNMPSGMTTRCSPVDLHDTADV